MEAVTTETAAQTAASSYQPIGDYGIIGDVHTAALISSKGSIDWFCAPFFDSPAIFLRILDAQKGGFCKITPEGFLRTTRRYLPDTNILETTFYTQTGEMLITDFMPIRTRPDRTPHGQDADTDHTILRIVTCRSGYVVCHLAVTPTFGYATQTHQTIVRGEAQIDFIAAGHLLSVQCSGLRSHETGAAADFTVSVGERVPIVLACGTDKVPPISFSPELVQLAYQATQKYWEDFSRSCTFEGEFRDLVIRSALTLKLLTFEPTGAIIAALTTSLPEELGGVRNWDYRYTWVRDSTFMLISMMELGHFREAYDFLRFLSRVSQDNAENFKILYSIHGQSENPEFTLGHLSGYENSRPVRIGNAAGEQKQLDIYGELAQCIYLYTRMGGTRRNEHFFARDLWPIVCSCADYVSTHWKDKDSGIWEVRSGPQNFVHSIAMCWVTIDCALKLARFAGYTHDCSRWHEVRDEIAESLLHDGYDPEAGAFVQAYGSKALDASVLRLPLLGVVNADDFRMRETVEAIEQRLTYKGMVYRYLDSDDGIEGGEGTFAICTFWLIENYILQGELEKAESLFRHVLSFKNDLGLFAEEIDPDTGEHLGNFPQAFTHIALINTAVRLQAAKGRREAPAHAVVEESEWITDIA